MPIGHGAQNVAWTYGAPARIDAHQLVIDAPRDTIDASHALAGTAPASAD
jgi:muramoyltetrapeptide carboxypeptidase